jgi:FtsP/CotA-like multicopper oxidase with cupredoxin domain
MRAFPKTKIPALLATVLAAASLAVVLSGASTAASQAAVTIELCAKTGTVKPLPTTDSGLTIPIWGFGIPSTPGNCATATASLPGPALTVNQGDTVTLTVNNALPLGHPISVQAPGIDFNAGPTDAAAGGTVTLTFTASAPGTYLYGSGGDAGRQEAMGLYGALVVNSSVAGQAYGTAGTAYDSQATLVLSQVDPVFNADPDAAGDLKSYKATYWLINGKSYPDTDVIHGATAGQRVLLRYLNAGYDNTTMALLGMHEHVVARDAHLVPTAFDADAETIPAGATEDAITTVPAASPALTNGFALYNRQLHITNGTNTSTNATYSPGYSPGGMLTFLQP